jgi:uncharacterized protein
VRREDDHLAGIGVKVWLGDIWNEKILSEASRGATVVIHCAGDPTFGNGPQYYRSNVQLTEHLITVIKGSCPDVERFVFVSTIGAMDRPASDPCAEPLTEDSPPAPTSDYGRSKLQAEDVVRRSGLPYTIIRPAMVVGAGMRVGSHFAVFVRHALERSPLSRVAWPGKLSVVHVEDLANALVTAATHPGASGRTYFCAGEAISIAACFDLSNPEVSRLPIYWAAVLIRPVMRLLPFSVKAILLPALTATDEPLRRLGWRPLHNAGSALLEVVSREKSRLDPEVDPGGQTVVTGAASGLGRALVERLAPVRKRLLVVDRDRDGLLAVASQFPNCRHVVADLAVESELDALIAGKEWNDCFVSELYACAGIGSRGRMQDIPLRSHKRMLDVNVFARLCLAHKAISGMERRQFGRVVLISSSSAFQPLPYMATYAATNSALLSLGEAWSREIAGKGVHMMTVCPGGMRTNFQQAGGVRTIEGEKLMSPSDVAEAIFLGLRGRRTTLIVSFRSFAMSLLARILPRRMSLALWDRLMGKMR